MPYYSEHFENSDQDWEPVSWIKKPEEIKLLSIISAVDEKIKTVKCRKESKKACNGKSIKCITHNLWDDLENHINKFFEENTLNDILFKEVRNNSEELKQ